MRKKAAASAREDTGHAKFGKPVKGGSADGIGSSGKKKDEYSNLSRQERKECRRREAGAKNRPGVTT